MNIFNAKIQTQIMFLVAILVAFQGAIAYISFNELSDANQKLNTVYNSILPSVDELIQADRDFQQALVAERTLFIPGLAPDEKQAQIKDYFKNRQQVIDRFNSYIKVALTKDEKDVIPTFVTKYNTWLEASNKAFNIVDNKLSFDTESLTEAQTKQLAQQSMTTLSKLFESSRDELDKLQEIIAEKNSARLIAAAEEKEAVTKLIFGIFGGCLILSLTLSFAFIRGIIRKVNHTIEQVENGALDLAQISDSLIDKANHLSSSSQQQSSSVTETSSSLHEISSMVKRNTDMSVQSAENVLRGKNDLTRSVNLILELAQKVKDSNQATQELIGKVNASYDEFESIIEVFNNIKEKTSVINDIVFQTKLLSFNASVEAARAGEHGKGFSVVAEEVGNLAHMSGNSSLEISELLEGSLKVINDIIQKSKAEVSSSVSQNEQTLKTALSLSQDCENTLKELDQMFNEVSESTNQIASASKEQNAGVEEINTAVQEIDMANKQTSQNAVEVEQESSKIVNISTKLSETVTEIKKLVA